RGISAGRLTVGLIARTSPHDGIMGRLSKVGAAFPRVVVVAGQTNVCERGGSDVITRLAFSLGPSGSQEALRGCPLEISRRRSLRRRWTLPARRDQRCCPG